MMPALTTGQVPDVRRRQWRTASINPCRGTMAWIGWPATAQPMVAYTRNS